MATESEPNLATHPYLLWCSVCGRSVPRTAAEVLAHTRTGWLRCCGQVMSYFTVTERPTGDTSPECPALTDTGDTALDHPVHREGT